MQDVECEIIQKYTNEYDSIIVFVEAPYFVNFYVNELFEKGDSVRLKQYARFLGTIAGPYLYNLILSLYKIHLENNRIKITCFDDNRHYECALYTIRYCLSFYPNCPEIIQKRKCQMDNLLQRGMPKSTTDNEKFAQNYEDFSKHFHKNKNKYKKTLSNEDFELLTNITNNFENSFDIRESVMCRNIFKHYRQEFRHIVIAGATHANKEKILYSYTPFDSKTKPLAWQLNNLKKSPFRHKVYTIHLAPHKLIFPETVISESLTIASKEITWVIPRIPNHIRKELVTQKKDVAIKMIDPLEYPDIHRQFDGFILIRKAHSTIPGNKETIEKNW